MRLGRLTLFIEGGQDVLLSPNTDLSVIKTNEIESILVDPGIPKNGESIVSRFRKLTRLIKTAIELGPKRLYIVSVDVWEPKLNVRLFRETESRVRELRLGVDYELIMYVHGYKKNEGLYRGIINDVIVGIPSMINTLDYPTLIKCSEDINKCMVNFEYALTKFSKIHFGGTGIRSLRVISQLLNSPFMDTSHIKWLSADTMITRWRYSKELNHKFITKGSRLLLSEYDKYLSAFMSRINELKF
jgi:hypothetical protein